MFDSCICLFACSIRKRTKRKWTSNLFVCLFVCSMDIFWFYICFEMKKLPNKKCWTFICLIVCWGIKFLKKSFLLVLRWESGQIENVGHPTNQTMQSSEFTIDLHKNLHWINKTFLSLLRINFDSILLHFPSNNIKRW